METRSDTAVHPRVTALAALAGIAPRRHLGLLVRHAPVVVLTLDADGRILESDGRGRDALVARRGETRGRLVREAYADAPDVLAAVERVLSGREHVARVDAGGVVFDTVLTPVFAPDGTVAGAEGIAWRLEDAAPPQPAAETLAASGLSPTQAQVACWIARDRTPAEVADRMNISRDTVYTHLAAIKGRLGVRRIGEVKRHGTDRGWDALVGEPAADG